MYKLYKKTHNITGLQYLGYTKKDPEKYRGSGTYWLRHLAHHGDDVTTELLEECDSKPQVKERGRYYSELWNVVRSDQWANLKAEEADGGDMRGSQRWVDGRSKPEFRKKQADGAQGNINVRGRKWWVNSVTSHNVRSISCPGPEYVEGFMPRSEQIRKQVSDKLMGRVVPLEQRERISRAAEGRVSNNKETGWVVDEVGTRRCVKHNDIPIGFKRVKHE